MALAVYVQGAVFDGTGSLSAHVSGGQGQAHSAEAVFSGAGDLNVNPTIIHVADRPARPLSRRRRLDRIGSQSDLELVDDYD